MINFNQRGCTDRPVSSVTEDLFDVTGYINALCSFVRTCDTPMTVSIQGDWGSGKTSMMNMMRENLDIDTYSIWFNTWQFSQFDIGNKLAFSMLDILFQGLGYAPDSRKKLLDGLMGFGRKAIRIAADAAVSGTFADMVGDIMEPDKEIDYAGEIMQLKAKFQQAIDETLKREYKNRVVIFIDDLDRLQPFKAVELLEVLKLFLDCDKCVFVLAVDYEVVTMGITQKFGIDVGKEKGRSFFDKMIQLPFKMPVANYNVEKYVVDMMNRMNMDYSENTVKLFTNLIASSTNCNPRSMKRLFNTFQLLDIVTATTAKHIEKPNRQRILLATICMQVGFEKVYDYIHSIPADPELFDRLSEYEGIEDLMEVIYSDSDDEESVSKRQELLIFMKHFIDALRIDGKDSVTTKDVERFKVIMKSSWLTSVGADLQALPDDGERWSNRYADKNLVKRVVTGLRDVGEYRIWQPRKEREGVKLSDVSAYCCRTLENGCEYGSEFYVSRGDNYTLCVDFIVRLYSKEMEREFFEVLGNNPLEMNRTDVIERKETPVPEFIYRNILRINNNDAYAAEQIINMVRRAESLIRIKLNSI